ncbi:MAG TPA: hypothetical protein VGS23_03670, partial [Thermoplasmata archaeon]|nr:hypothetical protein [Thermoplasmata archaeon]
LEEAHLDLVVANDRTTIGAPRAAYLIVGPGGARHWVSGGKGEAAGRLLDDLAVKFSGVPGPSGPRRRPRHQRTRTRRRARQRVARPAPSL